jgi:hypothetical protein
MSEIQKITESELSELKLIKQKYEKLIYNFGTLSVEKISLDKALSDYVDKEKKFLKNGGKFIFPLPDIEII